LAPDTPHPYREVDEDAEGEDPHGYGREEVEEPDVLNMPV